MRILIDTNVILDVLLNRKEFVNDSLAAIKKAISEGDRVYISSSAATDIYYLIRKQTGSRAKAMEGIKTIAKIMSFADVNEKCILYATQSKIMDFEDAVVDTVAVFTNASLIITRNVTDFKFSRTKVMSPQQYLLD